MPGLPTAITRAPLRTFRPQHLADTYTQPNVQLHRLVGQGRVKKIAHGIYYALPDDCDTAWTPTVEALAAGAATAVFGDRVPVLMHLSAARMHGALPRAIGQAVVAVPRQHSAIVIADPAAVIRFVARDVDALDATLMLTDLGPVLVTTPEQTALDLAKRPGLGGMPEAATEALRVLVRQSDVGRLSELAHTQRMVRTLDRLERIARA